MNLQGHSVEDKSDTEITPSPPKNMSERLNQNSKHKQLPVTQSCAIGIESQAIRKKKPMRKTSVICTVCKIKPDRNT